MDETSESLLELAGQAGNGEAWQRLAAMYMPMLQKWIREYGVCGPETDDLVQEVLLALSQELPHFRHSGRPGAFRAWLKTTLIHRLRHYWRGSANRPVVVGGTSWLEACDQLEDESSGLSRRWNEEYEHHVMARLMERVRERFDAKTWEAFQRQVLIGDRPDLVAQELGMSLSSVYAARSRVLKALRQEGRGLLDG